MAQARQRDSAKGLAEQASETLDDAASKAQETAVQLTEQGTARLRHQFDQRSTSAGQQVRSLAEALRRGNEQLGEAGSAPLTKQVAERVDRFGAYLERTSSDQLIRDVESFARQRPWMIAGLGTLAGLAAARFVKASSEQRYGSYRGDNLTSSNAARSAAASNSQAGLIGESEEWEAPVANRPELTRTR